MPTLDQLLAQPNNKQKSSYSLDDLLNNQKPLTAGTVQQVSGEPVTKESILRFLPTKEELPEFIGSLAGGLAKTTPTGIALSGGGAILGELARQVGEKTGIFEGQPPTTVEESLKRAGMAGLRGVTSETIGRGIGRLFTPAKASFTPEIEAATKLAESEGIKPPLSSITESKAIQAGERLAEYTPFGQIITKQKRLALEELENLSKRVGERIAPNRPSEVIGNLAKEELNSFIEKFNQTKDKLYDSVMPNLKNTLIEVPNTLNTLLEILERRQGTAEPQGLNQLRNWIKDISGREIESGILDAHGKEIFKKTSSTIKTFEELRKFRTNIATRTKFNDPSISGLQADLRELYGSISQDLDNAASKVSTDIADELEKADEFYAEGKNVLKSKIFKALSAVNPENVHNVVIVPKSPSQAQIGREILGDDTFREVTKQWFDDLIEKSKSNIGGDKVLSPQKLTFNIQRYGSTIQEIFKNDPEKLQAFNNLAEISKLLSRGKNVTEGSQTAFIQQTMFPLISALGTAIASPEKGLGALGGFLGALGLQGAGTGIIASDIGRELLTRGYPTIGKITERTIKPTVQIGLQDLMRNKFLKESQ